MPSPIEDYALIGDCHSAALVAREGSIDWLCLPRFDSAAVFASLLGDDSNGMWRIAPADATTCTRRSYRGDTLVLTTEWETPQGVVHVHDFMPPRGEAPDVVRIVEGVSGRVAMQSELRLRFDYGLVVPWVRRIDGRLAGIAGPDSVWLDTPVELVGRDRATYSEFEVGAGDRVPFVLTWRESHLPPPQKINAEHALRDTCQFWEEWADRCEYGGQWREAVVRSLITLKALTYAPTGGIVAAATTSLPEDIGGVRTWDYRYCWLRDASFVLGALVETGYDAEARAWREWLLRAVAGSTDGLRIMFGVAGERRIEEWEVPHLAGYEGSQPVRIGNAASHQFQLDVYGEVLDALSTARAAGILDEPGRRDLSWPLEQVLINQLENSWQQPDHSLWEVRGDQQHFVHSKVMAWVGADRAVRGMEQGLPGDVQRMRALRDEIHREVCERGWDSERNTFVQYYGATTTDAALLLMPTVGFLPPTDPRVIGTVDRVRTELAHDGLIRRYLTEDGTDGLPGDEGAFIACTYWLVDALALTGRKDEARETFEHLLTLRNDLGLLSEEYDVRAGRQLGNVPQAYSHVALVNSARALA
jgi:GH15 family glucan-1,4-alpha-glucosidase